MSGTYAGVLDPADPLYQLLIDTFDQYYNPAPIRPTFDVYSLGRSSVVYRYVERETRANIVAKFYGNKWICGSQTGNQEMRATLMHREYLNATRLRDLGLCRYPHSVVRPLAVSETVNYALLEDYVPGKNLDAYIRDAVTQGQGAGLLQRLGEVASFLGDLHNRSQSEEPVDPTVGLANLATQTAALAYWRVIARSQNELIRERRERWHTSGWLGTGRQVLVHGDANPTNFLFDDCGGVTAIDVECSDFCDRAIDLGCLVAELKHLFYWYGHDPWASEPYIRHFYACYAATLPGSREDFHTLTTRGRYHMACFLLRICQDAWLDLGYRRSLLECAVECLHI